MFLSIQLVQIIIEILTPNIGVNPKSHLQMEIPFIKRNNNNQTNLALCENTIES